MGQEASVDLGDRRFGDRDLRRVLRLVPRRWNVRAALLYFYGVPGVVDYGRALLLVFAA